MNAKNLPDWNTSMYFESVTVEDVRRDLEAGADVNARDEEGSTPLHWAVQERALELMAELLDARAYVNARDKYDITPLHYAARWSGAAIKQLVTVGADMDAQDKCGATPLHWAVSCENLEAIAALRDAGADLDAQDVEGHTPMEWAKWGRQMDGAGKMVRDKVIEALQVSGGEDVFMRERTEAAHKGGCHPLSLIPAADLKDAGWTGTKAFAVYLAMTGFWKARDWRHPSLYEAEGAFYSLSELVSDWEELTQPEQIRSLQDFDAWRKREG